jgi:hypothetical protein
MIARTWRGWVRTGQAGAYVEYITGTGLSGYRQTPGNLGAQMWTTDLGRERRLRASIQRARMLLPISLL